ncbi:MAG: putative S-adenosylmethionine-dependent methyltransferase, YraL family [Parcubacteria group bacterium Greene0416_79]|nr:MAG: putative S-adenosylmethionine-dependent methyltransferase, YraL family [Parcubacteria group bacterium Greene0416_79]
MGVLFIVGTPIGNLEDVTLRALRVLKEVDVILCEDTRVTKRLLERYAIAHKQLTTYNEQRSGITAEKVVGWLEGGRDVALVTDAGMPGISDPGAKLVSLLVEKFRSYAGRPTDLQRAERAKLKNLPTVVTVPGPSALTAALSIAGVPVHDFVFLGFLPHKKGRETLFREIAASERTMIFYESPHRIVKTLESLEKHLDSSQKGSTFLADGKVEPFRSRRIIICRELTKIHEEVVSGNPAELLEFFKNNPEKVRGEFVVIVADERRYIRR